MEPLPTNQIPSRKKIGDGGCGTVYQTENKNGRTVALKVFEPKSINSPLLQEMTKRLAVGGWPEGVMPVEFQSSLRWTMPLLSERQCLQSTIHKHPRKDSWALVNSLAQSLAAMHEREVAHGNLKPGNVFLKEDGGILLSDWALGNMPGITSFNFTDAVLYQPPEQLQTPESYRGPIGFRSDVFAFGVLSFRILTGRFPRCHETFNVVAPKADETRKDGIQADLKKVSRNLEAHPELRWPAPAKNDKETRHRDLIEQCLSLKVEQRPISMVKVFNALSLIEKIDLPAAGTKAKGLLAGMVLIAAAVLVMGFFWQHSVQVLNNELSVSKAKLREAEVELSNLVATKDGAETKLTAIQATLSRERKLAVSKLQGSRMIGDRLFAWAMENGNSRLPPLDARELRLKRLEQYFEEFLSSTVDIKELAGERANVRIQLLEVALAVGDAPLASRRLQEALIAWKDLPMDTELRFRMATNSLLLALLRPAVSDPETKTDFIGARQALEAIPKVEVDADRLQQLLAILDFHEAKVIAASGDNTKAMEQLLRATQTLNKIADSRPELAILRSELAACYLSSATILEGMGSLGDAREVRALATIELLQLLKNDPTNTSLRLDLAGCYTAAAESAILAGDIGAAENNANQALTLLDQILLSQPDNAEAVTKKASLLGLRAGVQRDKGLAIEAITSYNEGIRILEAVKGSATHHAMVSFRLALLLWQKGRMIGMAGNRASEIALIQRARGLLDNLGTDPSNIGPRPDQLQSSSAYLLGDLGHAMQLNTQKEEAINAFTDATTIWQNLSTSRPQSEEYMDALSWCRQRLAELK